MIEVDAVILTLGNKPERCSLKVASRRDLEGLVADERPRACVVRDTDVAALSELSGGVDKGWQTTAVELPRVFENVVAPVGVVRSRYKSARRLLNAVTKLVGEAATRRRSTLFLVGARTGDDAQESEWIRQKKGVDRVTYSVFDRLSEQVDGAGEVVIERLLEAEIVGRSAAVVKLRQDIGRAVERLESGSLGGEGRPPVLLLGETGTGKTTIAQVIHRVSTRGSAPFVQVNCPTLTRELYRAEMHGTRKEIPGMPGEKLTGYLEQADHGILMLEEVGDTQREIQAQMLDDIGRQVVRPFGQDREKPVDFWTIAATERNLKTMVRSGEFRRALFHRLAAITIHVPPLRALGEDRDEIARHLWRRAIARERALGRKKAPKEVPEHLLVAFREYDWPGNIRQLAYAIDDLVGLASSEPDADLLAALRSRLEEEGWGLDAVGNPSQLAKLSVYDRVAEVLRRLREEVLPVLFDEGADDASRRYVLAALQGEVNALESLCFTRSLRESDDLRRRVKETEVSLRRLALSLDRSSMGVSKQQLVTQFEKAREQLRQKVEEAAVGMHEAYLAAIRRSGRTDGVPYEELPASLKESSRQQALNLAKIFKSAGYWMRPLRPGRERLPAPSEEEVLSMAEKEHERWLDERAAMGWRRDEEKSVERGLSPYLVAWSELPDEVKEINREAVRAYPGVLQAIGIELHRLADVRTDRGNDGR